MKKHKIFWSAALLATTSIALIPSVAAAQSTEETADDGRQLDTITVTATRRDTDIQSTPVSMSALSDEMLLEANITDVRALTGEVPGLTVTSNNQLGASGISIRGIGATGGGIGSDDPVAIYIDDVFIGRPSGNVFNLVDVERVEVLRGPQGSLFGRNATGGAIRFVTKRPNFDEEEGFFKAGIGSFNAIEGGGYYTGPITDNLAFKISGSYSESEGYATNTYDGTPEVPRSGRRELLGESNTVVRMALGYENGPLSIDVNADYGNLTQFTPFKDLAPFINGVDPAVNPDASPDLYSNNQPVRQYRDFGGLSVTANYDLTESIEFTSISGYRETGYDEVFDSDGSSADIIGVEPVEDQEQLSQEFRISSTGNETLDWILGAYFFTEEASFDLFIRRGPGLPGATLIRTTNETTSYAAFVDASWHISDRLTLSGGLRYSDEEKDFTAAAGSRFAPLPPASEESNSFDAWTPRAVLDFQATEDVFLYASVSRGFKSGGFNLTSAQSFDPEFIWSYEAGIKADTFDGRMRTNLSAFYYDYTDLQVRVSAGPGVTAVLNAADAKIPGAELENTILINDNWQLETNIAYLDATYDSFISPIFGTGTDNIIGTEDFAGNRLDRAPEWQAFMAAQYATSIGSDFDLTLRAEFAYQDELFYTRQNLKDFSREATELVNLRATLDSAAGWKFQLYGENVFDERYVENIVEIGPRGLGYVAPPATWGVLISKSF